MFNTPWRQGMNNLAFSPDGHLIVAARNTLRDGTIFVLEVWACGTGEKMATIPAQRNATEHSGMISALAVAPSGQPLASGSRDHSVRLWDLSTLQCVERLHGNSSEVWALAFAADGQGIISGAKDGTIRLWPTNPATREKVYEGDWMPIKFSQDGRMLAAINDQSRFVLLNLRTAEPEDSFPLGKLPFSLWAGAVSDDFHVLVHPLPQGGFRVWDLQSRKSVDLESREIHRTWAAISPDGSTLQAPSEAPLRLAGKGALFSQDGSVVVTLHDKSIKVWNPKTRSLKAEFPVVADFSFGTPLALSHDGGILAAGSNPIAETENAVRLWDTHNGKLLGVCKGHTQGVRWLAFSPDGETLASVSDDSNLRFWNVRTQQELLSIQRLADPVRDILFSPDGHWLAARTLSGLRLLDGSGQRNAAANSSGGESDR
jgi:WD40 repeat protein